MRIHEFRKPVWAQAVVSGGNAPVSLSHASNAVVILDQKGFQNM